MNWAALLFIAAAVVVLAGLLSPRQYAPEAVCQQNADCVPASCCHPVACVPRERAPDCRGVACTLVCVPGTMDCGQGRCACIDRACQAVWANR